MHPILYSLTSKGQTQCWQIFVEGSSFYTIEGIKGGAMTQSAHTTCLGKNIGKKNETSGEEQAQKEAAAKHKKKLDSGYWENEADIHQSKFFEPMLAKKWEDYKDTSYPLYISAKYDGLRLIINKDGMFSRNGKAITSIPHIWESVKHLVKDGNITLDGELYNHDLKNDFNKIISLVKKVDPNKEELAESAAVIKFYIFDCFFKDQPLMSFKERYNKLFLQCAGLEDVVIVKNYLVKNREEAMEKFSSFIEEGYEGMMLRVPDSPYENKRSKYLLKYKEFQDEEFEIFDVIEGKGGRAGKMGRILFKMPNGKTFESNARGDEQYYTQLLLDKQQVCGKMATVRYQNLTPDGIPRFPVMVGLRFDI
jgi:DNA ligase-1